MQIDMSKLEVAVNHVESYYHEYIANLNNVNIAMQIIDTLAYAMQVFQEQTRHTSFVDPYCFKKNHFKKLGVSASILKQVKIENENPFYEALANTIDKACQEMPGEIYDIADTGHNRKLKRKSYKFQLTRLKEIGGDLVYELKAAHNYYERELNKPSVKEIKNNASPLDT